MSGEINTLVKLRNSINEELYNNSNTQDGNNYYYVVQRVDNPNRLEPIYTIDSIFLQ